MTKDDARLLISFVGGCVLLFLPFLGLKLFGIIHWSWLLITGPLWMPLAFVFALGQIVNVYKYYTNKSYQ